MTPEQLLGWAACATVVTGILMIGYKHRAGFLVVAAGGVLTGVAVLLAGNTGLVVQNTFAVTANLYSWWHWRRLRKQELRRAMYAEKLLDFVKQIAHGEPHTLTLVARYAGKTHAGELVKRAQILTGEIEKENG